LVPVLNDCFDRLLPSGVLQFSLKIGNGSEVLEDHRYKGVRKFYQYFSMSEIEDALKNTKFTVISSAQYPQEPPYGTHDWANILLQR